MYVVSVTIFVKEGFAEKFIEATRHNATHSRLEPGNVRFDILRAEEDSNRFLLYEAYHGREDFIKHQQTPHYLQWKDEVTDWMAQPRQGVKHQSVMFRE